MATDSTNNQPTIDTRLDDFLVPVESRSGVYSNALTVNTSTIDVVLNFVYLNPTDTPNGTLVSRVIISHDMADIIIDTLNKAKEQLMQAKIEQEK